MSEFDRAAIEARAQEMTGLLAEQGVDLVATTFVDNSGIVRTKAVPLRKLAEAAAWGVGASNSFDFFLFNDEITGGRYSRGPVGDLRLHPDLDRLTVLTAQPGWAWAPGDRRTQDGAVHPQDARGLAKHAVRMLGTRGFTVQLAFEVEWVAVADEPVGGPAYGYTRLSEHADYLRAVVSALDSQGIEVEQIHPEYAAGQFELSVRAEDPVGAADTLVLVRETIRKVSQSHGLRASFTPKFAPEGVGNGGHVHLSVSAGGENLFGGGDRRFGMTALAEGFSAGILRRLPALMAIGAPSVVSYLRLEPHHWAGVFRVWGLENREAPLRLIAGRSPNLEVKCFDLTANPYLVVAALLFAGLDGMLGHAELPEPLDVDPGTLPDVERLPSTLAEAVAAFESDELLNSTFGAELATTLVDVRKGEIRVCEGLSPDQLTEARRWLP
ncbi:glutamine synthetase [Amycolatopsis xylanica]|uniref:Glutamine synthetase n=1 Tax=Amycolatopsis xylanica TaxID=589385 RepID=A0A1H3Q8Y3_9PSEU|nr:glutamine synthetase family protein [Amycolatopsis xylanica]SDZ09710.1 glutamine synthetase [Amycolatopsis xylanica]